MSYSKTVWNDRIKDSQGNIVQEGTPVSAGNLNKIEKGIEDAHKQMEQAAKETVSLPYGLSVLNSPNGSPLDLQIEGRTLVSLGNSDLEGGKFYVLANADGRTAIVVDGTTYKGIAKFAGKNTRPTIIRTANFEGKVAGSTVENPHVYKATSTSVLTAPSAFVSSDVTQTNYDKANSLNATVTSVGASNAGLIPQALFSFNLIEEVERKIGKIPGSTVADKVTWLKNNINKLTLNWYGYGSSPTGNKASIAICRPSDSTWVDTVSHTANSVSKLYIIHTVPSGRINDDGFVHMLAYADPSDGVTASTINTDYAELQFELKANADFYAPRIPLYEVPQESYDKILVEWDAATVANRYPMVEGMKPLQNPVVTVEGENLLPPFSEWVLHANAKLISPYELELNTTGSYQTCNYYANCLPNTSYIFSADEFYPAYYDIHTVDAFGVQTVVRTNHRGTLSFLTASTAKQIRIVANHGTEIGTFRFKNPMLTIGSAAKPFKPRNPSYLYAETILSGLNSVNDLLYQDNGRWKVLKKWEESILDNTLTYGKNADAPGLKEFFISGLLPNPSNQIKSMISLKFNGKNTPYNALVNVDTYSVSSSTDRFYLRVSNGDTGFVDVYNPSTDEIKAYFNGWKVKTMDGSNKPTAWVSVIDGKDAATQTLDYVKANKAPDYTGYRLLYQLATPRAVDITDKVEGALSVSGQTQISIDSGVIVREKVAPFKDTDGRYKLNVYSKAYFNYKNAKILAVYKNQVDDSSQWIWFRDPRVAYGNEFIIIDSNNFDLTADYYITYLALDKEKLTTNPVNVKASYNTSIRSTVDQMNEQLADVKSLASIHDRYLYKLLLAAKANGWSV